MTSGRVTGAAGLSVETNPLAPGRANLLARLPGAGERPALINERAHRYGRAGRDAVALAQAFLA
jgi:hypothetical protein